MTEIGHLSLKLQKKIKLEGTHWIWTGFTDSAPRVRYRKMLFDARRFVKYGAAGKEVLLQNLCGNIRCVNPRHNVDFYSSEGLTHRFWERVNIADNTKDCWEWTGSNRPSKGSQGPRARFMVSETKAEYAYRWLCSQSQDITNKIVMHLCDNPLCVNPEHLKVANQQENVDDMITKWRHMHGEAHTGAKLNEENVREIRSIRANSGIPYYKIAEKFGVDTVTIWAVCNRKTWTHVE
jgi:hypothetical protein